MKQFEGQDILNFIKELPNDESCKAYLSKIKWQDGFTCVKCGHTKGCEKAGYRYHCYSCQHVESATANTLFHKVKFGLRKAFFICFEMSTTTKSLSASYMGVRFGVTEKTARLFMHKVREAMKSSENHPMDGTVHIDEFVVGGREKGKVGRSYNSKKKKVVTALELTDKGKIKRMYALKIDNFSSKELEKIFEKHIDENASITTDLWRGYRPLFEEYNITQIESNNGKNFIALHTMIHQVKSWIRTTYSWVSDFNINRYLDEFCYRLNRSRSKVNIFNNLIERMVKSDKIYQTKIICS